MKKGQPGHWLGRVHFLHCYNATTAAMLASQAEAIVRTRKTWPQATKRRTGD